MGFFIFFQMVINAALVSALAWLYLKRRDLFTQPAADEQILEKWKKEWELEKQNQEQQLSMQLRSMRLLCEQTKKMIEEKQTAFNIFPISQEENEIRQALQDKTESVIPTLNEFEAQKQKLRQESPLDLKSILNDQLC
jgi:hypothetical protein